MDRSLIDQFEAQADAPLRWIEGLSDAELRRRVIEGRWTMLERLRISFGASDSSLRHSPNELFHRSRTTAFC